jgi:hypothetical protein
VTRVDAIFLRDVDVCHGYWLPRSAEKFKGVIQPNGRGACRS